MCQSSLARTLEIPSMPSEPYIPASKPESTATAPLHDAIRRRAEEIYIRNGRIPGRDLENWAQAEREILSESAALPARRTAVVVTVNGVKYVGEYDAACSGGYTPGEFGAGARVPVRFDGDRMFVKRPNGKELETTIVKKLG
jgi:hypothetical protein